MRIIKYLHEKILLGVSKRFEKYVYGKEDMTWVNQNRNNISMATFYEFFKLID